MKQVEGKVAFITGAANGAGFGMAQVFAKNGMKVVLADIRQDSLDRAMAHFGRNPNVHAIRLDVADRTEFARAADEAEKVFGKVHVVCNNAGINLFVPMEECTYNDWDWLMGVNFWGVVNGIQTFIPRIRKHGEGGHIVNTASMAAFLPSAAAGILYRFEICGAWSERSVAPHPLSIQHRRFGFLPGPDQQLHL
jgi:NADP-dependent 3-hydroxy acid dehydrogenase YdfG